MGIREDCCRIMHLNDAFCIPLLFSRVVLASKEGKTKKNRTTSKCSVKENISELEEKDHRMLDIHFRLGHIIWA